MEIPAILVHTQDDVVVVTSNAKQGEIICYPYKESVLQITAQDAVPMYHKVSVSRIEKGAAVKKYGQCIGYAKCAIEPGQHVHTHNLQSYPLKQEE